MASKAIAKAYARRIKRGEITIDNVPKTIKDEVRKLIDNERWMEN